MRNNILPKKKNLDDEVEAKEKEKKIETEEAGGFSDEEDSKLSAIKLSVKKPIQNANPQPIKKKKKKRKQQKNWY